MAKGAGSREWGRKEPGIPRWSSATIATPANEKKKITASTPMPHPCPAARSKQPVSTAAALASACSDVPYLFGCGECTIS